MGTLHDGSTFHGIVGEGAPKRFALTGGSADYYKITIRGFTLECNDIIKHFGMSFAVGNIFKAAWRLAAVMAGKGKPGNTALYDAEKIEWFAKDLVQVLNGDAK